jgi:hypothetical protein
MLETLPLVEETATAFIQEGNELILTLMITVGRFYEAFIYLLDLVLWIYVAADCYINSNETAAANTNVGLRVL